MQRALIDMIADKIGHRLDKHKKPLPTQIEIKKLIKRAFDDFAKLRFVPETPENPEPRHQ